MMLRPGSTIGILGGGQLGRMSILAGRFLGYRFGVFDPTPGTCAGKVADWVISKPYEDEEALADFALWCNAITFEFENVPDTALDYLSRKVPVHPSPEVLRVSRNRIREKRFLSENGFPVVKYREIYSGSDIGGSSGIIKTAELGYDGKGQVRLNGGESGENVWVGLGGVPCVLEEYVEFECECSVVCARGQMGELVTYPVGRNEHKNHILHETRVPSGLDSKIEAEATAIARGIAEALNIIGILAVEFFVLKDGSLVVNEIAPRPHNSGHYTIDACETSQFEQHIRAVAGLSLGSTELKVEEAKMLNLLGDLWQGGEPDWSSYVDLGKSRLHLYDKGEPKVGRKMGHVCTIK